MIDRPVLASGVEGLQADQERSPSIGIEQLLEFSQPLPVLLDLLDRLLVAFVMVFETRVDVLELDSGARLHSEPFQIVHFAYPASAWRINQRFRSTGDRNLLSNESD